jgi:hypothetical protein
MMEGKHANKGRDHFSTLIKNT